MRILLIIIILPAFFDTVAAEENSKNVLILNSYHKGYSWTDDVVRAIEKEFSGKNVNIYHEYMDTKRNGDNEYINRLYNIYLHKFRNHKFDAIISSDDNAFNFLKKYRNRLFGKVPVVFCGVNYFKDADIKGLSYYTGVNEEADIGSGIELALKLHPDTKRIVIVNDTTTTGKKVRKQLLQIIEQLNSELKFLFLENFTMTEIQNKIAELKKGDLVLYTLFLRDRESRFYEYDQSIKLVSQKSKVPVYGTWDFSLGHGIIGGMLTSGYYQGESAAKITLRILNGEPVSSIPVISKSPNRYMFDYLQLQKFNLELSNLPESSIIINKPRDFMDFYNEHKVYVLSTIIAALLTVVLIFVYSVARITKANKKTEHSRMLYKTIFENSGTAMLIFEKDATISLVNTNFVKISGFSEDEVEHRKSFREFISERDVSKMSDYHRRRIKNKDAPNAYEFEFINRNGEPKNMLITIDLIPGTKRSVAALLDITERIKAEQEREALIKKLQKALSDVNTLSGLLPICASCKKVRDDEGYWKNIEEYIESHSTAEFSHGLCHECEKKLYGKDDWYKETKK